MSCIHAGGCVVIIKGKLDLSYVRYGGSESNIVVVVVVGGGAPSITDGTIPFPPPLPQISYHS